MPNSQAVNWMTTCSRIRSRYDWMTLWLRLLRLNDNKWMTFVDTIRKQQGAMANRTQAQALTPAFSLDFDPTLIFEQTTDQDFDKILEELDLELAGDNTNQLVQHITQGPSAPNGLSSASSDAGGLRELFGIQHGFGLQWQQPQQVQQTAGQQMVQQQQNGQLMQQAQPADMQQLLLQQQQLLLQQLQQQQQAQGLGVVYQLPSPFVQPLSALTAGLPLPGLPLYTTIQPGGLNDQTLPAQQLLSNAAQPGGPMFTFSALPSAGQLQQMQQPGLSVPLPPAAASASSAPGLFVVPGMPGAGPYMQNGTVAAMPSPSAATNGTGPVAQLSSEAGATAAGVGAVAGAAAQRCGRGRGRSAAPAVQGAEKPKGPSQKFRQRQKATINHLEAELTQKLAELQMLSEENEMLKLRSEVLEAVTSGREYHEKVIKEHGPPTFDVSETSLHSNHNSGSLSRWGSSKSHAAAATGSDSDPTQVGIAATIGPRSGSISSAATGGVTAGPAVATAAGAAGHDGSSTSGAGAGAAGAEGAAAGDGGAYPADPLLCTEDGVSTVDVQQRGIRCLRQMSANEILMHWKQFLRDVSAELLTAAEKEEQQRADVGMLGREGSCKGPQAQRQDSDAAASDDSAFIMSKVCRWCGRTNTEGLHLETGCSTAQQQQQQQQGGEEQTQQDPAAFAATAAAADPGSSNAEQRMVELVKKYSYMTKFLALLNPGAMDSLFGRNLDTGEAVPYNDEHWRNVVACLHLTKTQVAYLTACAELYFSSLCPLMTERKVLQEALMQADGALSERTRHLLGVDGSLDQLALLDRLSNNLKKEYVLRVICNCHVWGRVLTAVQFAKSAVYSHPFIPDVHAMVCVLYEDTTGKKPDCYDGKVFQHRIAAAKAALAKAKAAEQAAAAGQPLPAVDGSNVLASG